MSTKNDEIIYMTVPKGIRYISEWTGFYLPDFPCIIDKQITGCGFTEYCLTNPENVILCSPRKILLENKQEQHPEVLYVKNESEKVLEIDKDLTVTIKSAESTIKKDDTIEEDLASEDLDSLLSTIENYFLYCFNNNLPCKILVTYDSFRHVKSILEKYNVLNNFRVIVDEFQSILTDAKFKSSTEIEFLSQLKGLSKVNFVSATPMMDKYLKKIDEFKNLPYYRLDWETEDSGRVIEPRVLPHSCPRGIVQPACDIVNEYKTGNFLVTTTLFEGKVVEVVSKEAVFYVNSVRNICDIIKKSGLKPEEVNILCARTPENEKKLKKAFGLGSSYKENILGTVPLKGQPHKMFTFCTRTVYLGADFYSTNARSFIFSDANIDSLTVDIRLDLPQILGRQRLDCNPWRNKAELYIKTLLDTKEMSREEFDSIITNKKKATYDLLHSYEDTREDARDTILIRYQDLVKLNNYKKDYLAINTHGGQDKIPVFNDLVLINDERAYDIQQSDYKTLTRVFSSLGSLVEDKENIIKYVNEIESIPYFHNKMKYIYELDLPAELIKLVLDNLSDTGFSKYYWTISKQRASSLKYQRGNLEAEYNSISIGDVIPKEEKAEIDVPSSVYETFTVGDRYSKAEIKSKLCNIYEAGGANKTAKASDIADYFVVKRCVLTTSGKRYEGFEIIKKKDS